MPQQPSDQCPEPSVTAAIGIALMHSTIVRASSPPAGMEHVHVPPPPLGRVRVMDWETWIESLKPGDPVWHVDGRQGILTEMHDDCVIVMCAGGSDLWAHEDTEQPQTTAFHIWAVAQGEGE